MATLPKVLINQADSKSAGGVALRVRTQGHLSGDHHYTGITIRMVGIEEDEDALNLPYASKFKRRPDFLRRLFDLGRDRAPRFLRGRVIARPVHSAPHPVRASGALSV